MTEEVTEAPVKNTDNVEVEQPTEVGDVTKTLTTSWIDDIDEEYRTGLEKFKSINDWAKSHKNLEQLVGRKYPGADAKPEELEAFYKQIGRPDDAEGYSLPMVEGIEYNEEALKTFKETFHKAGLTSKQAQTIMEHYNQFVGEQIQGSEEQQRQAEQKRLEEHQKRFDELKETWGGKFEENTAMAQRAARAFGLEPAEMDKIEQAIGPDKLLSMFYNVGKNLSDDAIVEGQHSNSHYMTPQQATIELNKFMSDPQNIEAMHNKMHPAYKETNNRRLELTRISKGIK